MSLRKRNQVWWIDFVAPNGQRIRQSAGTCNKTQAQELHDKLKFEAWRVHKLGERPQRYWNDAVVRWLKERSDKATINEDKARFRWLDPYFGGEPLEAITRSLIDHVTEAKLAEGVSNSTANRLLEVIRAVLRKCVNDWEWLDRAPHVRMLKEPTRRIRFLTHQEAEKLLAVLPEHLADMAVMALATGLRQANITGLLWSQVDIVRHLAWIHPDQAKARKAIPVPLNDDAITCITKQLGKHPVYVFSFRGKPITQVSTKAWYGALKRAGIEDFRWHDLRHTWASWHVQGGTPLFALQELGGWESPEMVRRYAHLSADHLAPYANQLNRLTKVCDAAHGTNLSQPPEKQKGQLPLSS